MSIRKISGFAGIVVCCLILFMFLAALINYPHKYIYRVLVWQESDAFDWQKFPSRELHAPEKTFHFDTAPDERTEELLEKVAGFYDLETFLDETDTQSFIVLRDTLLLYEGYFNGARRNSVVTSFSVAKSFTSALIGFAIQDGFIDSVDDPVTRYLPELAERDERFSNIKVQHLLMMTSGLEYDKNRLFLFNGDDPLTTYYPDQRKLALENTHITTNPGSTFDYNKYHPQLLGMILERTTGMLVTEYLQLKIWDPLGMEFDGSWSLDSEESGFEKMETGVNARAIDFAKFGRLFLNNGRWQGEQLLPEWWVNESTSPFIPGNYTEYYNENVKEMPGTGYYKYMWWGFMRDDGSYDFMAEGDKGQFIYISPEKNLVIVRNGTGYGVEPKEWVSIFYRFSDVY
ncbi:MAG TPA: serine hydrolase [Balneolaceae bacterium]|nr:serine hydrolase [Balneolaceae bacterium]